MAENLIRRLAHLLCRCGADLDARDELHGATPLGWAAWFGCTVGCRILMEAGADPLAGDMYGTTPAQNALRHGLDLHTMVGEHHIRAATRVPSAVAELATLHGRWAEAEARCEAVKKALAAQEWCAAATRGAMELPGPALDCIAFHAMEFDWWQPTSKPVTPVGLIGRRNQCAELICTVPGTCR